ncbi:hypothetical protein [Fluviispira multicolorata]|uniref:Uncharacterized protein n=1 Tax=Fluviispira multicolorata TaxID=2654512 RepID=A0A833JGE4_9BACT|nr:hypothetical protein [Fluviispira multicolorata]KAB8032142.1 hypothetical protein GCL57_05710 [Fluviispira multicolorata]
MPLNLTAPTKIYKSLIQRSPIQVVSLIGINQYHTLDSKQLYPIAYNLDEAPKDEIIPPNQTHLKNLAKRTYMLINGGHNIILDDKFLSEKKDVILALAADSIGLACYDLARLARIPVTPMTSADQIIKSLEKLSFDTDDTGIIAKPSIIYGLRDNLLKGRISHFITGKLKTKNVIDYTYPIFTPAVANEEIIIYNIHDSFVIADPVSIFLTEHNQIAIEFKIDIQNKDAIEIYSIQNS